MNIYVGNLSYRLEEKDLVATFEQYGEVTSARIIIDRETGRSKGFGFIEMPDDEAGNAAVEALEGVELEGRNIRVSVANEKQVPQASTSAEGTIKWYDPEKGFGFITTTDKDVFVHRSSLTFSADKAEEGKTVSFEINESDRGPVAANVALVD